MAIKFVHVYKSYGSNHVLTNFNLTIEENRVLCVMGASGSGKSTFVNLLAGILKPDYGEIEGVFEKKFSMVFQEDRLMDWHNAVENVAFVMGGNSGERYRKAEELLAEAGLAENMRMKTAELSGGMKRRVAVCRALAAQYDILILDEPYKGLDSETKRTIVNMVKKHSGGKCVVFITHDEKEAALMGGRVVRMNPM